MKLIVCMKTATGNLFSLGMICLSLSYSGHANFSSLRQGMFSFFNRSFSTCSPLYTTTVLFLLLQSLYISYISCISSSKKKTKKQKTKNDTRFLAMFGTERVDRSIHVSTFPQNSPFVIFLGAQGLVRYGDEESMTPIPFQV